MTVVNRIASLLFVLACAACPAAGGGGTAPPVTSAPSASEAAPVDKTVRDLFAGYTSAATGDQARTALEMGGSPAFIAALKAKAQLCQQQASQNAAGPSCDADPVTCAPGHAALTAVVVSTMTKTSAVATAVITPDGTAPVNAQVTLANDGGAWKVQSIDCPK